MSSEDKNKQIADKIIDILRGGLVINADTQHYIDSTFAHPTIEALDALLQDESSCETESLMELLFFPDESVQLQLEDLLEDAQLQPQDEKAIRTQICIQSFQTRFDFQDGRGTLKMRVTPTHVNAFMERLNLTRSLDPEIRAAISQHVAAVLQTRCKVRFRNARPIGTHRKILFLQSFFEKMKIEGDAFFEYLDFTLGFLGALDDQTDIFKGLMTYKKIYFQGLQKAAKLEKQLTKHNVETLLLGGARLANMDKAEARKNIQMIDCISLAIFGKTDFFDLMPADGQSITLEGTQDINKLIQKLG
ncbi:MAG: hypothetical protein JRF36_09130 [Deltaproteobacteria bacterium]|jgi:hypothetical protein|nr:hypothetical protein [Deltaproteobacteria bacterium]